VCYNEITIKAKAVTEMNITLKELIGLTKELPEKYLQEAFEKLKELNHRRLKAAGWRAAKAA